MKDNVRVNMSMDQLKDMLDEVNSAALNKEIDNLNWILDLIKSDYSIAEIIEKIEKRRNAFEKQK